MCTIATFKPYDPIYGNGDIEYSSRKHTPSGAFNNASGIMYNNLSIFKPTQTSILIYYRHLVCLYILSSLFLKGVLTAQDETTNGYFKQRLFVNGFAMPEIDYR